METTRRTFLKAGLAGTLAIALGGGIYRLLREAEPAPGFALAGDAKAALEAIIPAMLAGALPADPAVAREAVARVTAGVHAAVLGLPLEAQQEVRELFGLLALAPARRVLAGVGPWPEAGLAEVTGFLQGWRDSRLGLLRAAYSGLHDLIIGAWYADPAAWEAIGYPGPINLS